MRNEKSLSIEGCSICSEHLVELKKNALSKHKSLLPMIELSRWRVDEEEEMMQEQDPLSYNPEDEATIADKINQTRDLIRKDFHV